MVLEFAKLSRELQDRIRRDNPEAFKPVAPGPRQSAEPVQRSEVQDWGMEAPKSHLSYHITLTQHRRRLLDGHDSLAFSLKPTVDFLTTWLGFRTDDHPRLHWEYHQVKTTGDEGTQVLICENF